MGYRAFLYLAALLAGVSAGASPQTVSDLNAADCDISTAAMIVAKEFSPNVDAAACTAQLNSLIEKLSGRLGSLSTPREKLEAMAHVLYDELGYASKGPAAVYVGLHEVVDQKQWNCLGLSILYTALGERLELPMRIVLGPGHALVQCGDGPEALYVETTDRGRVHSNLDYLKSYLPFPNVDITRFRALDRRETFSALVSQTAIGRFPGGKSPEAVPHFRRALEIHDRNAEAWAGLGAALSASSQIDEAIEAYRKAIELDPKLVEAYGGLGNLLHAQHRLQDAIAVYRSLLVACPREPRGACNLARLLYEAGEMDAAMGAFQQYMELQAQDPSARNATPTALGLQVSATARN